MSVSSGSQGPPWSLGNDSVHQGLTLSRKAGQMPNIS
jgi:hypothetical protein